ncbi:MAG: cytochrome c [Hyphomonadaceae bacterium]|nr:cytochrome c [Hyphomonadaceae bacterium]
MTRVVLLVALALSLAAPVRAQTAEDAGASAAERGRALYVRVGCYACHGYAGAGGLSGPRIAPDPLPAPIIIHYLRNPAGAMPAYPASVLEDAAVTDIRAYLATLPRPQPADAIPLLRE